MLISALAALWSAWKFSNWQFYSSYSSTCLLEGGNVSLRHSTLWIIFDGLKSLLFRGWLYISYYSVLASLMIGDSMKRRIVQRCTI